MHQAADGPLARVRTPGGLLSAAQLRALAVCADGLGSGVIELTSRANVQVRGLCEPGVFAGRIAAVGLLPSTTHERVRNIVASPFGDPGRVRELDRALCARPRLAELPGRFLFALDETGLDADVTHADGRLFLAGRDCGLDVSPEAAVPLMLDAAEAFMDLRDQEWRIAELEDGPARIAAAISETAGSVRAGAGGGGGAPHENHLARISGPTSAIWADTEENESAPHENAPAGIGEPTGAGESGSASRRVGVLRRPGGRVAVQALVPLGRLTPAQALAVAGAAEDAGVEVRLTPWRTVVLTGLAPGEAAGLAAGFTAAGLVTDPGSPWVGVTACAGRPGCAKSLADVRADAARWVLARRTAPAVPVHWAGCERRCGLPRGRVVQMVATDDGYREERP